MRSGVRVLVSITSQQVWQLVGNGSYVTSGNGMATHAPQSLFWPMILLYLCIVSLLSAAFLLLCGHSEG